MTTNSLKCCFMFAAFVVLNGSVANGQSVVATYSSGDTKPLVSHPAVVTFVATNSNNFAGAAGGRAVSAVAARAVPVPYVGGMVAEQAVGKMIKVFHKPKPVMGFNVAFVQGLTAATALEKGAMSFTVPAQSLQGALPMLLRLKPSPKDSARVIRSVHLSTKLTGGTLNPVDYTILGAEQEVIAHRREIRNGDVVLIPDSPLESGEYAIVLVSAQPDKMPVAGAVLWDFRVL